jgi:GT2 family glycosyltransferase
LSDHPAGYDRSPELAAVRATVIVVTYNSAEVVGDCLDALCRQDHQDREVVVVDNASTDGTAELVAVRYPLVTLVRNAVNTGYAGGCNRGFEVASGDVVAIIGPDCIADPGWLSGLVHACTQPNVGLATSTVTFFDDPERVNAAGNDVHVIGLGFCRGLGDEVGRHAEDGEVTSISGCAFAMSRQALDRLGGFDERFFMYCEDTDLSLRAWLAGYRVICASRSRARHRYRLDVHPGKFHLLERNRYLVLLQAFDARTLLRMTPALLSGELLMWMFAVLHGPAYLLAKARSWWWLIRHANAVRVRRMRTRQLRVRPDRDILRLLTTSIPGQQVLGTDGVSRVVGVVVNRWFRWMLDLGIREHRLS